MQSRSKLAKCLAATIFATFVAAGCGSQGNVESPACVVPANLPSPLAASSHTEKQEFYTALAVKEERAAKLYTESLRRLESDERWEQEEQRIPLAKAMSFASQEAKRRHTRARMARMMAGTTP